MKKILAMVLALCLMFCVSAASAEGMVDKIKEKGTLVLGTEATYGPYEFLDDDANPIGCDIWLAQQIADELGVELQVDGHGVRWHHRRGKDRYGRYRYRGVHRKRRAREGHRFLPRI